MKSLQAESNSHRVIANAFFATLLVFDSSPIAGVSFGLALVYCIFALRDRDYVISVPTRLAKLLTPLLLVCVVGLPGFFEHTNYDAAKDLWYFAHPIVVIAFAYLWYQRNGRLGDVIDIYSFVGVASAFMSFYSLYANWSKIVALGSLDRYRQTVDVGNMMSITAIALILLPASRGFDQSYVLQRPWLKRLILSISFVAVAMSFSRTGIICVVLAYLFSLSLGDFIKRFVLFATLGYFLSVASPNLFKAGSYGDSFFSQFVSKVETGVSEVSIRPFQSTYEIENNWRGYEASRALKTFDAFDALHQLIGGGDGQLVDLGFEQKVYDYDFVRIPTLHNGYAYILVKTGILGEILVVWFLVCCALLFRTAVIVDGENQERLLGLIILWTFLLIVLTETAAGGLYAKMDYDSVTCLVGICFAGTEGLVLRARVLTSRTQPLLESA